MNEPRKHEPAGQAVGVTGLLLCASLALAGCEQAGPTSAHAKESSAPPKVSVTVAAPVSATVVEYSEHTGHTEAPGTVEIRARASGHLTKAAFEEGELVKQGSLLFVINPRPYQASLRRARAELASIRVEQTLASKNLQRAEQLFKTSTIPEREWDTRQAEVNTLAARADMAAAALATAELDLEYAYVRSPIAGRVGRRLVTPGNLVGPSLPTPLATVVSVDPLYVYIDVDEARALRLGRAEGVEAQVGFPGEEGYPHAAKIDFVDNRVDPATGTIKMRAVVKNSDGRLAHGLFARVRLPQGAAESRVLVADQAVATDQDRRFVWVVDAEGKAQYRGVKLGPLEGSLRVVREGLAVSDRVVVRGLSRVRAGAALAPEVVSMNTLGSDKVSNGGAP